MTLSFHQARVPAAVKAVLALSIALFVFPLKLGCSQESAAPPGQSVDVDPAFEAAQETLDRHRVPLTADGMRKQLLLLDPNHPSHQQLEAQASVFVQDLNSNDYLVRENATRALKLMATVPKLQLAAAAESKDPEVAYRARMILDHVSVRQRRDTERGIIESVCIVVQAKKIKGMTSVLLKTLKLVDDPMTQTALGNSLAATAEETDVQQLRLALQSEIPAQRIASAMALLKLLGSAATGDLQQLLETEGNDHVRVAIARSLANAGVRDSIPTLIGLLDSLELNVRVESGQVLRALTDQRFEFVAYESPDKRKVSVDKWQSWHKQNGQTAELQFPLLDRHLAFGRILYADYKLNKVVEVDMDGKEIWSQDFKAAWNVQGLPNGHRLVSSYSGQKVVEFDVQGNEAWKLDQVPHSIMGLHRLDNGNTLVGSGSKVMEYRNDGTVIWEATMNGRVSECQRLPNGNTVISLFDKNSVVEVDPQAKTVWSINTGKNPMSVHRTDSGTTLIALYGDNRIKEYDREKRVVWEFSIKGGCSVARRLPNGDTLINGKTEIQLVSPDKKIRWSIKGLKHSFGLSAF